MSSGPDANLRGGAARRSAGPTWLWLLPVLAVAAFLRFHGLDSRSLWLDELTSIEVAGQPLARIALGRAFDNHTPPLYYVLLHLWLEIAPRTTVSVRLLSSILDLLNVLVVGICLATVGDRHRRAGLVAAGLYAFSPFALRLAQDARMYPLLGLLAVVFWWAAVRFVEGGRPAGYLSLMVATGIAGCYTHYYFLPLLLILHLWGHWALAGSARARWQWWGAMSVIGLGFVPWVPVVLRLAGSGGQPFRVFSASVLPYALFRFVAGYGVGVANWSAKLHFAEAVRSQLPVFAGVGLVALGLLAAALICSLRTGTASAYRSLALLVLGVPLLAWIVDQLTASLSERYLSIVFPFFLMLLARLPWGSRRPLVWPLVQAVVGAVWLAALGLQLLRPQAGSTDWRAATRFVADHGGADDPILATPRWGVRMVHWYLPRAPIDYRISAERCEEWPPGDRLWRVAVRYFHTELGSPGCGYHVDLEARFDDGNGLLVQRLERAPESRADDSPPSR